MANKIQSGKNAGIPYYSAIYDLANKLTDISVVRMQRWNSDVV